MASSVRTDMCGTLTSADIGRTVALCGWVSRRREHGEHLAFIDLRDHTGVVQCVVDGAHDLRSEYVVRVLGTVRERPAGTMNANLKTGEIEVGDCAVEVLSTAEAPPFPIRDDVDAEESVRLRYRYLDLRRDRMQKNLRVRATINSAIRRAMERQGFVEIETPFLIASTPEGARDFVVPARLQPGNFYVLPQSPQLFKQLCMVGGIDRYYQIARCARDEDLRADRQFEFTQLDAEASFTTQAEVHDFIAEAVLDATEAVTGERPPPIPRMTWTDAMERYGSDKPDVRFGLELVELTEHFSATEANVFKAACVKGIRVPGGAAEFGRNRLDALTDKMKSWGAKGLAWVKVADAGGFEGGVSKLFSDAEREAVVKAVGAEPGDLLLMAADERAKARHFLGLLRLELGRPPINEGGFNFLWIVDFPLFDGVDDDGRPTPAHHMFTMPHEDDIDLIDTNPLQVRSQSYDLVVNGWELGSGSIRIHRPDIQQKVFSAVGIDPDEAQRRFGFLLDAFKYGAPPHGGFAFGIDRLAAVLAGEENIREVIAFPKTQSGVDLLTGAPSGIDERELAQLGIRTLPPKA